MSPYDSYPLDHTGHGPTGVGDAPTARETRMQAMNQFRTNRLVSAMPHIDPYVTGAAGMTMRALTSSQNSPAAARRAMYQSAGGQAALDAAMMARRSGMLGQGDPVNYAANIAQGVASGGFQTSFGGKNDAGRDVYGMGHVSGQGAISERVSMSFGKGLLQDLYGSGTPDPGKLHGFDMEETSGVFKRLAQRGIIGHMAHVEQNASLGTRVAAAQESEVDRSIKHALSQVKTKNKSDAEVMEQLDTILSDTDNDKLERTIKSLKTSKDAIVTNKQARKKVSEVVEAVTEGMAGLADIYGDLSASELHQKFESMSGMRITNPKQARQARTMVNTLRGAAEMSDMDPRAFMETSSHMQAMLQGDVARAGGFDSRTATQAKRVTAQMHTEIMGDAAISSKLASQAHQGAQRAGINAGAAPTLDEIYEDKRQGRIQFLDKYKSVAMTQGGLENFSGDQRKRAEDLLQQFKDTSDIADPKKQARARHLISSQLQGEWASLFGGDFNAATSSRAGKLAIEGAYSDPQRAREMERMAQVGRRNAINVQPMVGMLEEMGAGGGLGQARQLRNKLGLKGMTDFSAAQTDQERRDILSQAGISGTEADEFMNRFVGADGLKDEEGFKQMAGYLGRAGWEGGMAEYDQSAIGVERMAMIGKDSNRKRLRAGDKGISINSIATALTTGEVTGISDPESMALALDALGEDSELKKRAKGRYATGMDFSKGLTKENLAALEKVHGGKLGLAAKMGYEDTDALLEASKGDMNVTADALQMLQTDEDYAGLNLSGDQFGMTAIDDELVEEGKEGRLEQDFRAKGARLMLNKALGMDEKQAVAEMKKESFMRSRIKGSKFKGISGNFIFDGSPRVKMGEGLDNVMDLSGLVGSASASEMKSLAALDEDADLVGAMESQYEELAKAKKAGGEDGGDLMVHYKDQDGKDAKASIDELMSSLKQNIERLSDAGAAGKGSQIVEEMTVTTMKVENNETKD